MFNASTQQRVEILLDSGTELLFDNAICEYDEQKGWVVVEDQSGSCVIAGDKVVYVMFTSYDGTDS